MTNSFEKTKKSLINHWETDDKEYYLEFIDNWRGTYGEFTFEQGEIFDFQKLEFNVAKLDIGSDFYEWVCQVIYKGKFREEGLINKGKRIKRLKLAKTELK